MLQKILIISLLFLLFISACKKEQNDPYIMPDSVIIGDYTNMLRHIYDSVILCHGESLAFIDLDMDNDKISDIRLISLIWGSVGSGHHPRSELYCLTENASISGYNTFDTTFFSYEQSSNTGHDSTVNIDEYYR